MKTNISLTGFSSFAWSDTEIMSKKMLKIQNSDENKDFISNVYFNVYILLMFFKVTQNVLYKIL